MSFCCPIHGYYHPVPGTTLAMCPTCIGQRAPKQDAAARMLQRCPVCEGRGFVAHGFYLHPAGQPFTSTGTGHERCQRCDGIGTIPLGSVPA